MDWRSGRVASAARPRRSWTQRRWKPRAPAIRRLLHERGRCARHGVLADAVPCGDRPSGPCTVPITDTERTPSSDASMLSLSVLTVRLKIHCVSSPRRGHSETTRQAVMGTLYKGRSRAGPRLERAGYGTRDIGHERVGTAPPAPAVSCDYPRRAERDDQEADVRLVWVSPDGVGEGAGAEAGEACLDRVVVGVDRRST